MTATKDETDLRNQRMTCYRRVTRELRRRGRLINHQRIARFMKMHGPGDHAAPAVCSHHGQ